MANRKDKPRPERVIRANVVQQNKQHADELADESSAESMGASDPPAHYIEAPLPPLVKR